MKKQLIITTGIVLSACSNSGYNDIANAYIAPQYTGAHYQMSGGCGPTPMPCLKPKSVHPCDVVAPCAQPRSKPCPVPVLPCASSAVGAATFLDVQPIVQTSVMHHVGNSVYNSYGLRSSYMPRKQAYSYGELGAVNYKTGKSMAGIQGRVGYQTANIVGAEVEGSLGIIKKDFVGRQNFTNAYTENLGVKNSVAGFAVARVALNPDETIRALGRIGYHSTKKRVAYYPDCANIRPCSIGAEITESVDGLAIGAAIEKEVSQNNVIRADVTGYDMGNKYNTALSLGYQRKF